MKEYNPKKYKILEILKSEDGKIRTAHTYRIIKVEGDYKRARIYYILQVNKNQGFGWYELIRSTYLNIIEKEYLKWIG